MNSGSPVTTDASNLRAVATAKQSAYDMAYSALISDADKMISEEGGITWIDSSKNFSNWVLAEAIPSLLMVL